MPEPPLWAAIEGRLSVVVAAHNGCSGCVDAASKYRQADCGMGAHHQRRAAKRCHAMEGSTKIFGS